MADENSQPTSNKDLARGADGALYIISQDKAVEPVKLSEDDTQTVNEILDDLQKELERRMKNEVSGIGSGVNLPHPPPPPPPFHHHPGH
jgi:hypothetical protein